MKLTDEEIAAMPSMTDADRAAIMASQARIEESLAVQERLRESAMAKFTKLGLTPDEIQSLLP